MEYRYRLIILFLSQVGKFTHEPFKMPEKVWIRFERRKKDGTVMKLRIQDMPPEKIDEVIDLLLNYFARDEAIHKAVGINSNPKAVEGYLRYLNLTMRDPACRVAICCADADGPQEIMGLSGVALSKNSSGWDQLIEMTEKLGTEESKKLIAILYEAAKKFDPIKEYNLSSYYRDRAVLVLPEYRGMGLAEPLLTVRRLMCGAHGVPMTGAWMTAYGTQVAAARGGWRQVAEISYDDLARTHGVTFVDAPPTMKFMVATPLHED